MKEKFQQKTRTEILNEFFNAPDDALFDQKVIAEVIGCSVKKLERDRFIGKGIPFIKIGSLVKYRKGNTVEWIDGHPTLRSTSENPQTSARRGRLSA